MSAQDQNRTKTLEKLKSANLEYRREQSTVDSQDLSTALKSKSSLESLIQKVEMCLNKQQQVHFISREIAEIVKKSS